MVTGQDAIDFMTGVFSREEALKLKKRVVVTYIVEGDGGGTWQLTVADGTFEFSDGDGISPVTATVVYKDAESCYKLVTGEMSGVKGYATGAIKFEGPANILVSLGKVFNPKKKAAKEGAAPPLKEGPVTGQDSIDFMTAVFDREEALKLKKKSVLTYRVPGETGGSWQLTVDNGNFEFTTGETIPGVNATVEYRDVESFYKLVTGQLSGVKGYATGAIKFEGPANLLVSLGKVFPPEKKKHEKKERRHRKRGGGLGGYMGKVLRVDLEREVITEEKIDEAILKQYVGGTGLGVRMLYDEVPETVNWDDPANRLIYITGPFTGTNAPGSSVYTVATRGALTNMFVASHANGFFGMRLKQAGVDGIIFQGVAKRWVYLYINDGKAELRDAAHLIGKDTWETEDALIEEVGEPKAGVSCIGPAGEHGVRYAGICSDKGHICSTNGVGTVMGQKRVKAVVAFGKQKVPLHDEELFKELVKEWWDEAFETMWGFMIPSLGTNGQYRSCYEGSFVPIKNLTTNIFPDHEKFAGDAMRDYYKGKPRPCAACRFAHIHSIELKSGPGKGMVVEEAEFEGTNAFAGQIFNGDVDASQWLNHINDVLGMDVKEQAFNIGLAMECYEKGLLTKEDCNGLDLSWGNVDAIEQLLYKIANREEGIGDLLADGVYRSAQKIGGEAPEYAVYTHKGNAPHVHDGRGMWSIAFSMAVSDMGSIPAGDMGDVGDLLDTIGADALDPEQAFSGDLIAKGQAITGRRGHFIDCLGICMFVAGVQFTTIATMLNTITGWNYSWKDCVTIGERVMNMMRAYNVRCGHTREHNTLSPRLLQAPINGAAEGISIEPDFDRMIDIYYDMMGWDSDGKPLPKTLKRLGLKKESRELASMQ